MTRSEIFSKAHEIAKQNRERFITYRASLSAALKSVYASLKKEKSIEEKLVEAGANIWEKGEYKRAYLSAETVENLGFVKHTNGKWYKNDACINSNNMNSIINRAFFDCRTKMWNFSKCNNGFSTEADQTAFVENAF